MSRGYFGIGICGGKTPANVGTLWRSATIFDAAFIFTIGHRYPHQCTDTIKAPRHVPLWRFDTFDQFHRAMPEDIHLIGVEQDTAAKPLPEFLHPERAVYLLGAEDHGLLTDQRERCDWLVEIPTPKPYCMNVAVAGSIILADRYMRTRDE